MTQNVRCPTCGKLRKWAHGKAVSAGIAMAKRSGKIMGRPQRIDKEAILTLRAQGLTAQKIANRFGYSIGSVAAVIKGIRRGELK